MNRSAFLRLSASFLGLFTVAVASFFLMGYLFNKPGYYTWPKGTTPVALPTAVVFISLGSAIFILAKRHDAEITEHISEEEHRLEAIEKAIRGLPCNTCPPGSIKEE